MEIFVGVLSPGAGVRRAEHSGNEYFCPRFTSVAIGEENAHKHVRQQAVVAGNFRKTVCSLAQNVSKNCRERFINRRKMNVVTVNILPTKMHNCAKGTRE